MLKRLILFSFVLASLFIEIGCTSHKNLVYMQDRYELTDTASTRVSLHESGVLKLLPGDNLYIRVYGVDLGQLGVFNRGSSNYPNQSELSLYMQGYIIDDYGNIELPVLGVVKVEGLTLLEAKEKVQVLLDEYIKGGVVDIRLLSFQITVLGEVRRPGTYTFLRRDMSILDALGKAGDMNDFGDKRSVLIIRKINNYSETVELNMTSSDFFNDPYFWLEPNDIVYVKPLKAKMININGAAITIVLSGLTTLFLFISLIK